MAELHAKEAPARVHELEAWGAVFDRTQGRQNSPAQFRRPQISRGSRTSATAPGWNSSARCRITAFIRASRSTWNTRSSRCSRMATASSARSATTASADGSRFSRQRPWCSPPAVWAAPTESRAIPGKAPATAFRSPITPARNCGTWNSFNFIRPAWFGRRASRGMLVTEGVRGEGGVLQEQGRQALHVRRHSRPLQKPDLDRPGGRLALRDGRQKRQAPAGIAHARPRGALHHARGQGRTRQPARRRVSRHRLDQGKNAQRA